jgi:hypothetical protein
MSTFYITVGQTADDDNQETVLLSIEQLEAAFDALDLDNLDDLSTAIDKILGNSGLRGAR